MLRNSRQLLDDLCDLQVLLIDDTIKFILSIFKLVIQLYDLIFLAFDQGMLVGDLQLQGVHLHFEHGELRLVDNLVVMQTVLGVLDRAEEVDELASFH